MKLTVTEKSLICDIIETAPEIQKSFNKLLKAAIPTGITVIDLPQLNAIILLISELGKRKGKKD